MAEALGVVASILSICHAVSEGVNVTIELYNAPAEIKTLQEQVQIFRGILRTVEATREGLENEALDSTLSRARTIIEELYQVITLKLVREGRGSDKMRRLAWMRYKSKVVRLRDDLKDAREALLVALSTDLWLSTHRIESTLTIISQQASNSPSTTFNIQEGPGILENVLDSRQSVQLTRQVLPAISDGSAVQSESEAATPMVGPFEWNFSDTFESPKESTQSQRQSPSIVFQREHPAGPFELSRSFQSETYTNSDTTPRLISYDSREDLGRVQRIYPLGKGVFTLPTRLDSFLKEYLEHSENLKQDAHLTVYLGQQSDLNTDSSATKCPVRFDKPPFDMRVYLQEMTDMIYHWKCMRYSERELTSQLPLGAPWPKYRFIASLRSRRWVLYWRIGSNKTQIKSFQYNLWVFHRLEGVPGVNPFLGVVLDEHNGAINGFLCELPAKGSLLATLTRSFESSQPVAWERREKWCRQVVQAVTEVHSKGLVVGSLADQPDCGFAIDAEDNAVLWEKFQTTFKVTDTQPARNPPEYRQLKSTGAQRVIRPETDIYQLGVLLWQIATNKHPFSRLPDEGRTHMELHFPEYLVEVIAACRLENPNRRPPAWKLLEKFPAVVDVNSGLGTSVHNGRKISPSMARQSSEMIYDSWKNMSRYTVLIFVAISVEEVQRNISSIVISATPPTSTSVLTVSVKEFIA
ncbi:MAG: hypothetical protein M1813_000099 [Trichoglossum hirsutum]|nr:MAG: hypothetical protein M1813_000099 [Trichoglossum hirsutum]